MQKPKAIAHGKELIKTKEFATRISVTYSTAHQLMHSLYFRQNGLVIKVTPENKKGGLRVDWERYLNIQGSIPVF